MPKTWNYSHKLDVFCAMQHCTHRAHGHGHGHGLIHTQTRHMHMISCSREPVIITQTCAATMLSSTRFRPDLAQVCAVCVHCAYANGARKIIIAVSVAEREYVLRMQSGAQIVPGHIRVGSRARRRSICGDVLFNLFEM